MEKMNDEIDQEMIQILEKEKVSYKWKELSRNLEEDLHKSFYGDFSEFVSTHIKRNFSNDKDPDSITSLQIYKAISWIYDQVTPFGYKHLKGFNNLWNYRLIYIEVLEFLINILSEKSEKTRDLLKLQKNINITYPIGYYAVTPWARE